MYDVSKIIQTIFLSRESLFIYIKTLMKNTQTPSLSSHAMYIHGLYTQPKRYHGGV